MVGDMPYDQFAPCAIHGCEERRAKRRRYCARHAAWVKQQSTPCTASASYNGRITQCARFAGHDGPHETAWEILNRMPWNQGPDEEDEAEG